MIHSSSATELQQNAFPAPVPSISSPYNDDHRLVRRTHSYSGGSSDAANVHASVVADNLAVVDYSSNATTPTAGGLHHHYQQQPQQPQVQPSTSTVIDMERSSSNLQRLRSHVSSGGTMANTTTAGGGHMMPSLSRGTAVVPPIPADVSSEEEEEDAEEQVCGVCFEVPPKGQLAKLLCCRNLLCMKDAQRIGTCPFCREEPLCFALS